MRLNRIKKKSKKYSKRKNNRKIKKKTLKRKKTLQRGGNLNVELKEMVEKLESLTTENALFSSGGRKVYDRATTFEQIEKVLIEMLQFLKRWKERLTKYDFKAKEVYEKIIDPIKRYNEVYQRVTFAHLPNYKGFKEFASELKKMGINKMLSIGSGSGFYEYWIEVFSQGEIKIKSTTLKFDKSGKKIYGTNTNNGLEVENITAKDALKKYGGEYKTIFASWLPPDSHISNSFPDPNTDIIEHLKNNNNASLVLVRAGEGITETKAFKSALIQMIRDGELNKYILPQFNRIPKESYITNDVIILYHR